MGGHFPHAHLIPLVPAEVRRRRAKMIGPNRIPIPNGEVDASMEMAATSKSVAGEEPAADKRTAASAKMDANDQTETMEVIEEE